MPGTFVTFEGGEGTGKSTQLKLLADVIMARGLPLVQTREPGGTPEAEALRTLLVNGDPGRWTAEAVYLAAETAVEADQLDKARELFERVGKDFGKSPYAGRALDGLAFLAEGAGDYQKALELYQRVANEHPEDFLARRKPYDIGRMQEKLGQLKEAADSYDHSGAGGEAALREDIFMERAGGEVASTLRR